MMEALRAFETSVNIYLTTRQYVPEDWTSYSPPSEPELLQVSNIILCLQQILLCNKWASGSLAQSCKIVKRLQTVCAWKLNKRFYSTVFLLACWKQWEAAGRSKCWENGLMLRPERLCGTEDNGTGTNKFDSPFVQGSIPSSILVAAFTLQKICTVPSDVGHISTERDIG
jgi:hypothetical protein